MKCKCLASGQVRRKDDGKIVWVEPGMVVDIQLSADGKTPAHMEKYEEPKASVPKEAKAAVTPQKRAKPAKVEEL